MEELRRLKRARSAAKGSVTRKQNEIKQLLLDLNNSEVVKGKVLELDTAMNSFEVAHELYHALLTEEEDIEESSEYYLAEKSRICDLKQRIEEYLASATAFQPLLTPYASIQARDDSRSEAPSHASTKSRGSSAYSRASAKAKADARKAVLEAEATLLKKRQEIQHEEFLLKQRIEELEIQTEIAKANAEAKVYTDDREDEQERETKIEQKPLLPVVFSTPKDEEQTRFSIPKCVAANKEADDSLKFVMARQTQQMEQLLQQQQKHTFALMLPQPEVPVFNGDPTEYCSFVRAFESLIESKTDSESVRLYYLVQYTSGDVQELMRSCLTMSAAEGYREARSLLRDRYRQSYKIAAAYVRRLTEGQPIKSETSDALRRFSTLLTSCKNTLKEIGYLSKVQNPDTLKRIIDRLSYGLRLKWRDVAYSIAEKGGREVTINDISAFVEERARIASLPIFGNVSAESDTSKHRIKDERGPRKVASFATQVNSQPSNRSSNNLKNRGDESSQRAKIYVPKCPSCQASHWLSQCTDFKRMSLDERHKLVRSKGLCDNCLVSGHISNSCPKESFCKVDGCQSKHSTWLHPKSEKSNENPGNGEKKNDTEQETQPSKTTGNNGYVCNLPKIPNRESREVTGLSIVPVKVRATGSDKVVETYAFLDGGSNTTFCTESLKKRLDVQGEQTTLSLTTIEKSNSETKSTIVGLEISNLDGEGCIKLPAVFSIASLPVTTESMALQVDVNRWPHFQDINLPTINAEVDLLIGNDVPQALQPNEVRTGREGEPYAMRTVLGWVINGPLGRTTRRPRSSNFIQASASLESQFRAYCDMEFNDSLYDGKTSMSQEDKRALKVMEETIHLKDGHYELSLPWKHQPPRLENNRGVAERRLNLLKRRLTKDSKLLRMYTDYMNDILQKGYAKLIPEETLSQLGKVTWYLPHHPVFHPQKPGKVRVVFDCSAKHNGTSLNEQLLQGPDLTNSLVGVLTRFREAPVAFMSDVEAMFHQVRVTDQDCDALRFLWWPNGDLETTPQEYQMQVHLFGGTSSPSCANFALRKTARDNKEDFDQEAVDTVNRNFYVDDCLKSVETEAAAIQLVDQLRRLLAKGGFRLTKWLCNSQEVMKSVPESERAPAVKDLDFDHLQVERALGIRWNVASDKFGFKIDIKDKPPTRRGILSLVCSVYDPLGFAAPFILPAKMLLQDLCRKKLSWDEGIGSGDLQKWNAWKTNLPKLEGLVVNRCLKPENFGKIVGSQLHNFSDASQYGYGAVTYLRIVNANGQVHCSFIIGKARLAPLKPLTVPRMELSAAVLATRLDKMVKQELSLPLTDESIFWTDSTCVLGYIENESKRFHTFVANRIAAIHDATSPSQWRYVNTASNPADEASRGLSITESLEDVRWIHGPPFLWQLEASWPSRPNNVIKIQDNDPELKIEVATCATLANVQGEAITKIFERFSSWIRLKKFVAWMLRLKRNLRNSNPKPRRKPNAAIEQLNVEEMRNAEIQILKYIQLQHFKDERARLAETDSIESNKPSKLTKASSIYRLDPVLHRSLIRVGGRLKNAKMKFEAKHPILLPKQHHVVTLIIRYYHQISGHSGVEHVLSQIREKFWIINARAAIKNITHDCVTCRKRQGPVAEQKMADLPNDRVTADKPPFTFVGVDCFGPFLVRRARSQVKRYGVLYTCMTSRAIHIEVAHSLDTDAFINSLRRFVARRGVPEEVRSDNGTNFVSGERELRTAIRQWNQQKIHEFLLQRDIKWTFNPPAGSHHGGVWERCIRTVRKVMNGLSKEQVLDDEGLATLMCEVESIVNSRPITKCSEDPNDMEALTPNHLLLLRCNPNKSPGRFEHADNYTRRRWRQVQYLADVFWRRWLKEYLPSLQERQKWYKPRKNLAVGDIVLVVDDTSPRGSWPLGRIIEVHYNRADGYVRRVTVKTTTSVLKRPVDKLVLLESSEQV